MLCICKEGDDIELLGLLILKQIGLLVLFFNLL